MAKPLNINNLPDVPLLIIFSKLHPSDLFQAGFVCQRWGDIQRVAFKNLTHLQIKQHDFEEDKGYETIYFNESSFFDTRPSDCANIQFREHRRRVRNDFRRPEVDIAFDYSSSHNFTDNFPSIRRLTILYSYERYAKHITKLIEAWSSTLEEVVLIGFVRSQWPQIENALNKCSRLKTLTTTDYILNEFKCTNKTLTKYNSTFNLAAWCRMVNAAENGQNNDLPAYTSGLTKIGLSQTHKFDLLCIESLNPHIGNKLDRLEIVYITDLQIDLLVAKCANLTYLDLTFSFYKTLNIEKVFTGLSQFEKLNTLKVKTEYEEIDAHWEGELSLDAHDKVPQLKSVKTLKLNTFVLEKFVLFLVNLFPNIEQQIQITKVTEKENLFQLS